jgi:hypothetical protein
MSINNREHPKVSRLILVSNAKKRLLNKIKMSKRKPKISKSKKSSDIMNIRGMVVSGGGGPGTGKRR